MTCCVDGCTNGSEDEVTLFKFPASRAHRRRWLEAIRQAGPLASKLEAGAVVCSAHFRPEDCEDYRGRMRLKRKVVPSIFKVVASTSSPIDQCRDPSPSDETQPSEEVSSIQDNGPLEETLEISRGLSPHSVEENCVEVAPELVAQCPAPPTPEMDQRQDIEDILTNYHIRNTPGDCPMHSPSPRPPLPDPNSSTTEAAEQDDCLMLLENVQVDVDPSALMMDAGDYNQRKDEHISLLTSSDEDDVIIEEPTIDTVEVSDETDEDDMPLVKLVKTRKSKDKQRNSVRKEIAKVIWGLYDYYCIECPFTSTNRYEFNKHRESHAKILQVCDLCGYTTASEAQFSRHKRKHKDDKKYKCHFCDYKAKHSMSLIYHLKSHDGANLASCEDGFVCTRCSFQSSTKNAVLKHVKACGVKRKALKCEECQYVARKESDLKKHRCKKHMGGTEVSA